MQPLGFRRLVARAEQRRGAFPADLDASVEIGLGARHLIETGGAEGGLGAEDLRVRPEPDLRAAAIVDLAFQFQGRGCHAA